MPLFEQLFCNGVTLPETLGQIRLCQLEMDRYYDNRMQVDSLKKGVRGLFSAKVPNSSSAEVRMGLLIEPTHMEDEDEDQETVKSAEWRIEEYQDNNMRMTHG